MSLLILGLALAAPPFAAPFALEAVDEATGRGVPLIEFRTVSNVSFWTDSAGVAAVDDPALLGKKVHFTVGGPGYRFAKDGFGIPGRAVTLTPGGRHQFRLTRTNLAERLYRVTGEGVYLDSHKLGRPAPVRHPLHNALVVGQDSTSAIVYKGRIFWLWGDTGKPSYPLGNFHTPAAWSDLPDRGGLTPSVGVDLTYYTDKEGFAKECARLPGDGPTWLAGVAVLPGSKPETLVAHYHKIRPPLDTYQRGVCLWDDRKEEFVKHKELPLDLPAPPAGQVVTTEVNGRPYFYYTVPFPAVRVPATLAAMTDPAAYESYTCLKPGTPRKAVEGQAPAAMAEHLDRGPDGNLRFGWKRATAVVPGQLWAKLIEGKHVTDAEAEPTLRDRKTGKRVVAHAGSVRWNAYRKRWLMITTEIFGTSALGEVWVAEADQLEGPWRNAVKVVSHERYSFYNPVQHAFFDGDGGRTVFFEGTYTREFSGNPAATPRYDYNQIMYRLDLAKAFATPPGG